jgi:hypothetical protein
MKPIVTAICVVASLTSVTLGYALDGDSTDEVSAPSVAIRGGAREASLAAMPQPVYIPYTEANLAAPAPGCNWERMPVYDTDGHVNGWRGDPVEVCP